MLSRIACRVGVLALISALGVCLVTLRDARSEARPSDRPPRVDKAALATLLQSFDRVEEQEHPWGWIRWLMNDKLDPGAPMTFGLVQINAGEDNPLHIHPNCDELLYVLSGSCAHRIGDQTVTLKAGDLLRIPTGVPHAAKVLGDEPMKAVIVYSSGDRQFVPVNEGGS